MSVKPVFTHGSRECHMPTPDRQELLKALLSKIDEARVAREMKLPGERELAQSFGASRSSVREALGVFEVLRVIERRPQSGIYVRPAMSEPSVEALVLQEALDVRPSTAEYEQAQEARIIHEVEAVRLAATRRSSEDLAAMRRTIEVSSANLRHGRNLADDDEAFHLALIAAAKNPILLRISKSLYLMTGSVRLAYFEAAGSGAQSIKDHMRILQSIARRDAAGATKLMKRHYAGSSARWRKVYLRCI
jgi:GntR family transcriptional regulator, transcriptional repressor for pyruvate dehydrogenase complex